MRPPSLNATTLTRCDHPHSMRPPSLNATTFTQCDHPHSMRPPSLDATTLTQCDHPHSMRPRGQESPFPLCLWVCIHTRHMLTQVPLCSESCYAYAHSMCTWRVPNVYLTLCSESHYAYAHSMRPPSLEATTRRPFSISSLLIYSEFT
jgi:hypothetical protein